jgi:hypothetical protein
MQPTNEDACATDQPCYRMASGTVLTPYTLVKFCAVLLLLDAGKCNFSISHASTISAGSKERKSYPAAESSKRLSPFGQRHFSRADTLRGSSVERGRQALRLVSPLREHENLIRRSWRKSSRASPSARQAANRQFDQRHQLVENKWPSWRSNAGTRHGRCARGRLLQVQDLPLIMEMHTLCKSCFRRRDANCWNTSRRCCHVR